MSDNDTDDTDLLLLIPPHYYTESAERESKMNAAAAADAIAMSPPPLPQPPPASTTAAYQFLMPSKKTELNQINARLQNMELSEEQHFEAPSDISSISTNTVRTAAGGGRRGIIHSTPKCEQNLLLEIDHYLDEQQQQQKWSKHYSDEQQRMPKHYSNEQQKRSNYHSDEQQKWSKNYSDGQQKWSNYHSDEQQIRSNYHSDEQQRWSKHHSDEQLQRREYQESPYQTAATSLPSIRLAAIVSSSENSDKLMSLNELWGNSLGGTVLQNNPVANPSLKEEQLRRQHLEKMVQTLQTQLLEFEQRISVAIEVDSTKNAALQQLEQQNKTLNFEMQNLRDSLQKLEVEHSNNLSKSDALQQELLKSINSVNKLQQQQATLVTEVQHSQQQTSAAVLAKDQLELQLQSSKRVEELSHAELTKLRDKYAKLDYQQEKLKTRLEELEKDNATLQQQKQMLQEYHQKQKTRADQLEIQRKSLQEALSNLTDIETNLKRKLEIQQKSLKQHYQQQMENVVAKKLQEFQLQLDKLEEQLKSEARERERLIAERAVKQLEMINEKNNQELNLIQEKHNEEVELYRLQLANASKKIDELDLKLSCYKSKRADIAEKLHGVMEAQWQQALAILTSPNHTFQIPGNETDAESPELNNARHYPDTPKSSRTQRSSNTEKNNLDVVSKKDPSSPMDKLQAYIELLLSKSPSDFDKLDQILALSKKQAANPQKRNAPKPPPWKA